MSFYWSDRKGEPAPQNAQFHFLPFTKVLESPPLHLVELPAPTTAKVIKRTFLPDKDQWMESVEKALSLINAGHLQKVVLARVCRLELDHAPNPFALTASLEEKAEGAFVFCREWEGKAFLGASPERLFARRGPLVFSEAVAGTRPRGKNFEEDAKLKEELLTSEKDLSEFSPVQDYLQDVLSPLCEEKLYFTPNSIHKTQNVQHLYSQCSGRLKLNITDQEILARLHPTPALCGLPKLEALSLIQELEPFDRGLYGGVIGWNTPEASEWIVGIRSCLLEGNIATLFSGAGIVKGSNAEEEWEELNQKLKLYDAILVN